MIDKLLSTIAVALSGALLAGPADACEFHDSLFGYPAYGWGDHANTSQPAKIEDRTELPSTQADRTLAPRSFAKRDYFQIQRPEIETPVNPASGAAEFKDDEGMPAPNER